MFFKIHAFCSQCQMIENWFIFYFHNFHGKLLDIIRLHDIN